jgi:tripartite-type tricarboxylate transporter receptor subunit TctC
METGRSGWFAVLSFVSLLGICLTPAQGADVSFKGKRINALIGSSPGGGTDTGTRLVGRFLQQYLPGKPQLVYRNMPAGQGIKGGRPRRHVLDRGSGKFGRCRAPDAEGYRRI